MAQQTPPHGGGSRPKRTRSWRVAKRIEDNASKPDHREGDVDLVGFAAQPAELDGAELAALQNRLGLADVDMAVLFSVDPSAMEHWRRGDVPEAHLDALR